MSESWEVVPTLAGVEPQQFDSKEEADEAAAEAREAYGCSVVVLPPSQPPPVKVQPLLPKENAVYGVVSQPGGVVDFDEVDLGDGAVARALRVLQRYMTATEEKYAEKKKALVEKFVSEGDSRGVAMAKANYMLSTGELPDETTLVELSEE